MTKETMTVHEALCELKIIGDRIDSATNRMFIIANKHSNKKIDGVSIEETVETIKSNYQKVNDLITRRNAIKRAVVDSNAKTKIIIGDKEYTVAEAIEMNKSGIYYQEQLMRTLNSQYIKNQNIVKMNNDAVENKADNYVADIYGNKDSNNTADIEAARKGYVEAQSYELIDPINIKKEIEKLEAEIALFKTKVDSQLSISNAVTTIEIEY